MLHKPDIDLCSLLLSLVSKRRILILVLLCNHRIELENSQFTIEITETLLHLPLMTAMRDVVASKHTKEIPNKLCSVVLSHGSYKGVLGLPNSWRFQKLRVVLRSFSVFSRILVRQNLIGNSLENLTLIEA